MTATPQPAPHAVITRFLLGTHMPGWLRTAGVPLFLAAHQFDQYRTLPRAAAPWALDSGGFSQLQHHGTWTLSPAEYVTRVRRYREEIGHLEWAAPQDWMCEPVIITGGRVGRLTFVGTHLSEAEHQRRTVNNYLTLRDLAPDLPFIPVVQGYTRTAYLRCADLYDTAGVDLTAEPLVGVGSVCRRQATTQVHDIILALRARGITRLHGFGVKTLGLTRYGHLLTSADSMAWSVDARYATHPLCGQPHPRGGTNCANCLPFALAWRARLLDRLATTAPQLTLDDPEAAA